MPASALRIASAALAVAPATGRAFDQPDLAWAPCPDFMPRGCALSVLHGDPAAPGADAFFKVPGGAAIPLHWHHSDERMVLVSGRLRVRYDGEPERLLTPGQYAYGPPRAPHAGRCESRDPCVLFIAFSAPVDAMAGRPAD